VAEQDTRQVPVPRGRHAPPLEVRLEVQRQRLFDAAATAFSRMGYAEASAEAISREAGMSKATFYEHFANKEECILALADHASAHMLDALLDASRRPDGSRERHRAGVRAVLDTVAADPALAQAVLVELVGAGPRAAERRDATLNGFAEVMYAETVRAAERDGGPAYASPDDAFAIAGATFELISRQLRTGRPQHLLDLEPIIERLIVGVLTAPAR
jgi:AcrR family transcriptional regulator